MIDFKLSTGTKFFLLLFYTTTITYYFSFNLEILNLIMTIFLILSIRKWEYGIKILFIFMLLTGINHFTSNFLGVAQVFHTWALILRRLLIPFSIGYYFVLSTNISSVLASLEKMRIPKVIVIPLIVMLRYMPALGDEYRNIKNAMRIRGIELGFKSLKAPQLTLEYLLVPLLFSTSNIGEELSQAAFSKGIGLDGKKERYFSTHLTKCDFLIFIYLLLFIFLLMRR